MRRDDCLPVRVAGLEFKNPFYVASGPTARTVEQLVRIERAGWAAASVKLSMDPPPYINRVPRYAVFQQYDALAFTAEKRLTLASGTALLRAARKKVSDLRLMANITYAGEAGPDGWVRMAQAFAEAGADIIEFNMCCPNMSFNAQVTSGDADVLAQKTGASMGQNREVVTEICRAVRKAVDIPIFVKLTPEGGHIAEIAKALFEAGADAVGGTGNRLGIPPIDLENPERAVYHLQDEISMSCFCGGWLKPLAQRDCYEIRKVCGPDVSLTATGGIRTAGDAIEMTLCGADLLGICTETLMRGYEFIGDVIAETRAWLDEHGRRSLSDIRDRIVPAVRSAPELTLYKGAARVVKPDLSAPCQAACPAGVPIQTLMKLSAEGRYTEAAARLSEVSPLQGLCGAICDAPCERACVKGRMTRPLAIRELERFLAAYSEDVVPEDPRKHRLPEIAADPGLRLDGKTVYIRSAGLAGIACAADLMRAGCRVVLGPAPQDWFHALPADSPARLFLQDARDSLRKDGATFIDEVIDGLPSGSVDLVYDTGRTVDADMLPGAKPARLFVSSIKPREKSGGTGDSGKKPDPAAVVAVLGDGYIAAETARLARDAGYRAMVLSASSTLSPYLASLVAERCTVLSGVSDLRIEGQNIRFVQAASGLAGTLACFDIVDASEARQEQAPLPAGAAITVLDPADPGPTPVRQIAAGKAAAAKLRYGQADIPRSRKPTVKASDVLSRAVFPVSEAGKPSGLTAAEQARAEAGRCLRCGCGEGCDVCRALCCESAIALDGARQQTIDPQRCVACGMCYNLCPNTNITMISTGEKA